MFSIFPWFGSIIAHEWKRDNSIQGFMRFIFRGSGSLIGVYVGLVFAYGSIAYYKRK